MCGERDLETARQPCMGEDSAAAMGHGFIMKKPGEIDGQDLKDGCYGHQVIDERCSCRMSRRAAGTQFLSKTRFVFAIQCLAWF